MPLEARDVTRLTDMLHHARLGLEMMGSRSLDEFKIEIMVQLAVIRCIEVIGEAGHQVSPTAQALMPTRPWHQMWAMRNRLIHDYGHTDIVIVCRVTVDYLPVLIRQVGAVLAREMGF
jgi:uncharacterized protein with HEPN domain